MGYFSETVDDFDLIDGVDRWRETAVDTEYLVVDYDRKSQEIEHIRKVMPHIGIAVFATAFGIKAI